MSSKYKRVEITAYRYNVQCDKYEIVKNKLEPKQPELFLIEGCFASGTKQYLNEVTIKQNKKNGVELGYKEALTWALDYVSKEKLPLITEWEL